MAKFQFGATVSQDLNAFTARLGAGSAEANNLNQKDVGKFVKLVGDSRYDLVVVGDLIEGEIISMNSATQDGFSIGAVVNEGRLDVTFDGSQAAGTGNIAVGDYVVAGTPVAKGTALTVPARVRKATVQLSATAADLATASAQVRLATFAWRVVSLGDAGTGAPGTQGVIERVGT